ncbi:Sec-independent protein translocase TatC [Candidatus Thermokryptus mobilis]|uniref:Sec-independent protein translocase protein TatC n=1 Tax=Candidatus Thermokryptus mobilis TaxID=1643428 RepID=A0A0S4N0U8_9BACT|nr:twin-arginine translocase subunit TatC [Candidatus Thermokryptus mobilis]CUU04315.1 Sec-independent protein translocase TatC [Candidatus Thermokryptus mobilis]
MAEAKTENTAQVYEKEMTFWEHLEELRSRIIKSLLGILIGVIICAFFSDEIVNGILIVPAKKAGFTLQNLKPYGQFMLYMQVVVISGIVLSFPFTLYQIWKFVEPGLLPKERKYVLWIVAFSSFCFFAGLIFAYFVLLPISLKFFAEFGSSEIKNIIAINEYISFVIGLILASGIVFELPMVSFFLGRLGILTPAFMRHYRKHAVVLILIIAAVLTPGPDIASQAALAIPLYLLYELSIFVVKLTGKKPSV